MALAQIVTIPDCYTCRGMTFLPQQLVAPVPAGEYDVLPEREVSYSDLGRPKTTLAAPLVNTETGETWYVGLQVASWLLSEHRRPMGRKGE